MARAVLVVGSTGAGKSTLINDLVKGAAAPVGTSLFSDGTKEVSIVVDPDTSAAVSFVDTPGLDSREIRMDIAYQVKKLCPDTKVLVVLVISKSHKRISTYKDKVHTLMSGLYGAPSKFIIALVGDEKLQEEDTKILKEEFPSAIQINIAKKDFKELKTRIAEVGLYTAIKAPVPTTDPTKKNEDVIPVQLTVGFPLWLSKPDSFTTPDRVPREMDNVMKSLLVYKDSKVADYKVLILMGESLLETLSYQFMLREKMTDTMEDRAAKMLLKTKDSALSNLFSTHLLTIYEKVAPGKKPFSVTDNCDFVLALAEYARKTNSGEVLKFVTTEIFKSLKK
jgi:energy-coupling factor transporter ATP-binding protein EcfA2